MRLRNIYLLTGVLTVLVLASCGTDTERPVEGVEGVWQAFPEFEGREIRLEVELMRTPDGTLVGDLDLPDLGLLGLPLAEVSWNHPHLHLASPIGLAIEASMEADGNTMEAVLHSDRLADTTLTLVRDNPEFARFAVPRLGADGQPERTFAYHPPPDLDDGWTVDRLDANGIDITAVEALVEAVLREEHGHLEAMLVARNGRLLLEEYFYGFSADRLHSLQSITKSVTSLLVGIALERGDITSLEQPFYEFFPEYRSKRWIEQQYPITLWHALTMSAAIDWNESVPYSNPENSNTAMNATGDWLGYVLDREQAGTPGDLSSYTSGLSILLGGVIRNATGSYVDEFAEQTLFGDLGVSHYNWLSAPDGTRHTGGGLSITARDLAKVGQLVLNGGSWRGQQVVSADWIAESTARHLPLAADPADSSQGYGFQWWHLTLDGTRGPVPVVAGLGYGGQYLLIMPTLDMVVVFNAGEYDDSNKRHFDMRSVMENGVLPAVSAPVDPV